jgi:flagella basal body P-ring formation protein FlgA
MNDKKGRMEDNPNDPEYAKALAEYQTQSNLALLDAAILLCTDIESIPEGIDKPEDSNWSDNLWLAGINVDQLGIAEGSKKRQRYLAWVKFYAAANDDDIIVMNREISRANGVSEGDVTAAMAAYKSNSRG